jgi:UPF0716 family protein affecting phage T7 exclusion
MSYLEDALQPLKQDGSVIKKSLIGTLALFGSIFILPYFLYQGYLLKILRESQESVPSELPSWDNLGDMFVLGLGGFILSVVITIPVYVIMYTPAIVGASEIVVLVGQVIGFLISLILSYFTPALLTLYARDGLGGVTDLDRLGDVLLSGEYLIAMVLVFVLGACLGIGVFVLTLVTLGLGLLLLPFIMPAYNYFVMYIVGNAVTEAERWESVGHEEQENMSA